MNAPETMFSDLAEAAEQDAPMSLADMRAKYEALGRQIAEAQKAARSDAIYKIKALMAENGLTVADLAGFAGARQADLAGFAGARQAAVASEPKAEGKKVAPKYRNPETGETWTGRGLKPKWLAQALAEGKSLEDFAITAEAEAVA